LIGQWMPIHNVRFRPIAVVFVTGSKMTTSG
jgi:hypothetical protein